MAPARRYPCRLGRTEAEAGRFEVEVLDVGVIDERGHDRCVVGKTLMYLHDAPDGMLVPHARYPDGLEKVYADPARADEVYDPDRPRRPAFGVVSGR